MRNCLYVITHRSGDLSITRAMPAEDCKSVYKVSSGAQLWRYLRYQVMYKGNAILYREGEHFMLLCDYQYMDAVRDFQRLRPLDAKQLNLDLKI